MLPDKSSLEGKHIPGYSSEIEVPGYVPVHMEGRYRYRLQNPVPMEGLYRAPLKNTTTKKPGSPLQHVSGQLQADKDVVLATVTQEGTKALPYASKDLQAERLLQAAAVVPLLGLAMQYPNLSVCALETRVLLMVSSLVPALTAAFILGQRLYRSEGFFPALNQPVENEEDAVTSPTCG